MVFVRVNFYNWAANYGLRATTLMKLLQNKEIIEVSGGLINELAVAAIVTNIASKYLEGPFATVAGITAGYALHFGLDQKPKDVVLADFGAAFLIQGAALAGFIAHYQFNL